MIDEVMEPVVEDASILLKAFKQKKVSNFNTFYPINTQIFILIKTNS